MNKGITLIELMITISVISIFLLVAIPTSVDFLNTVKLKAASNALFTKLRLSRSEALKTNSDVYISLVSGNSWCYGTSSTAACNCSVTNNCLYLGTPDVTSADSSSNISMSLTSISNNFLFSSDLGASSSSGTITFSNGSNSISVVVSPLGRIRMCSNNVSGYSSC